MNKKLLFSFVLLLMLVSFPVYAGGTDQFGQQFYLNQKDVKKNEIILNTSNSPTATISASNSQPITVKIESPDSLTKIFLTAALTIIGGILIYTAGEIITKFFLDPIKEQKSVFGEVADALIYYANIYANPNIDRGQRTTDAEDKFRQLSTFLRSKTQIIPIYGLFEKIKLVIPKSNINSAADDLILLSNSMSGLGSSGVFNASVANRIRQALGIYIP